MHRDVLAGRGGIVLRVDRHEDPDTPPVGVAGDASAGRVEDLEPPNRDVLPDPGHELPALIIDGGAAVEPEGAERLDPAGLVRQHEPRDLTGEPLELFLARDEVGLAVDLHHGAAGAVARDRDQPFRRGAPGLAVRRGEPALAHRLHRRVEVAARLHQRLLAIHHPGPGPLPERLDLRRTHPGHRQLSAFVPSIRYSNVVAAPSGWPGSPVMPTPARSRSFPERNAEHMAGTP